LVEKSTEMTARALLESWWTMCSSMSNLSSYRWLVRETNDAVLELKVLILASACTFTSEFPLIWTDRSSYFDLALGGRVSFLVILG
jgi:hypothetical protein